MFDTSLDILYIALAVIILLVGILLAIAIVYLIMILRDVSKASYFVRDTAKQVNEFVYKPLSMAHGVIEKLAPIIENLQRRGEEMAENAIKKRKGRPKKK
jgi:hypothetical protein